MKCDTCKNVVMGYPTQEDPLDDVHCHAGHWCGIGDVSQGAHTKDPWENCEDYRPEFIDLTKGD